MEKFQIFFGIFFQNNAYLAFLLVFCRFIYFFSEITCSRMIDFKKVYQAVNRPSNTDSTGLLITIIYLKMFMIWKTLSSNILYYKYNGKKSEKKFQISIEFKSIGNLT